MTEKKTSLPFPTFSHKGKSYFIPNQYDNVSPVDKTNLPKLLARIIPHLPLRFDENDILYPLWPGSKNDMVSLSGSDEWE
ncbi:MAG: hypothetical protein JW774_11090, partial [Candidatus Aureabacteria bacterium]|nr:hypothetical protein [Candidatus Auribacterota bacterium]